MNKIMFPLGERTKNDKDAAHSSKESVRNIAKFIKLPVASKLDSRGICFLEQIDLLKFLSSNNAVNSLADLESSPDFIVEV